LGGPGSSITISWEFQPPLTFPQGDWVEVRHLWEKVSGILPSHINGEFKPPLTFTQGDWVEVRHAYVRGELL
jgi:hypothetical protein